MPVFLLEGDSQAYTFDLHNVPQNIQLIVCLNGLNNLSVDSTSQLKSGSKTIHPQKVAKLVSPKFKRHHNYYCWSCVQKRNPNKTSGISHLQVYVSIYGSIRHIGHRSDQCAGSQVRYGNLVKRMKPTILEIILFIKGHHHHPTVGHFPTNDCTQITLLRHSQTLTLHVQDYEF